jgi:hypothetical protein
MYSMRFLCVLFLSACAAAEHIHAHQGHQCMHDAVVEGARAHWKKHNIPDRFTLSASELNAHSSVSQASSRRLQSYSNIRILIKTDLLVDGKYVALRLPVVRCVGGLALPLVAHRFATTCRDLPYVCEGGATFIEGSGQATSFSDTRSCTSADVMHFGDAKYLFLINNILRDAVEYFSNALSVLPVTTTMSWSFPETWSNATCFQNGRILPFVCCDSVLPTSAKPAGGGITNTDFVLYVTKRPTIGSTLAWALPCFSDYRTLSANRPVLGQANFSPARLNLDPSAYAGTFASALQDS